MALLDRTVQTGKQGQRVGNGIRKCLKAGNCTRIIGGAVALYVGALMRLSAPTAICCSKHRVDFFFIFGQNNGQNNDRLNAQFLFFPIVSYMRVKRLLK